MATRRRDRGPQPTDAAGFRTTWTDLEILWAATVARAGTLPERSLHQHVNGEWSFVQTLRHLVFVTDSWAARALLGEPAPYHPLGLPPTGMRNPGVPQDTDVHPTLAEVLAIRAERQQTARRAIDTLTDDLLETTVRVRGAGHPRAGVLPVRRCALALVSEEWHHRAYAERDLAILHQQEVCR